MALAADPQQRRTVGVFTKPDRLESPYHFYNRLLPILQANQPTAPPQTPQTPRTTGGRGLSYSTFASPRARPNPYPLALGYHVVRNRSPLELKVSSPLPSSPPLSPLCPLSSALALALATG